MKKETAMPPEFYSKYAQEDMESARAKSTSMERLRLTTELHQLTLLFRNALDYAEEVGDDEDKFRMAQLVSTSSHYARELADFMSGDRDSKQNLHHPINSLNKIKRQIRPYIAQLCLEISKKH